MNMKRQAIAFTLVLWAAAATFAQGPNGTKTYYKSADGKSAEALKTALFNIIKSPNVVSYSGLLEAYKKTDTRADGSLRDWYSNITSYTPGSACGQYKKEGDAYNREHSMPQSWYGKSSPMVSDIMQVLPTDGYVNNRRSDNPFGEVGTVSWASANSYSKLGSSKTAGYSGTVFEPNDEVKGDIARIYFYMMTCYEDRMLSWTANNATDVIDTENGTKLRPMKQWVVDLMMRWSKLDPVDDIEVARNNAVQTIQKNRNPFVDYPGLEQYIWGTKTDVAFSYDQYEGVTQDDNPGGDEPDPGPGTDEPGTDVTPTDGTIMLTNAFFETGWVGVRPTGSSVSYTAHQNGITITYALGSSSNMYAAEDHIRLYPGNTLTVSTDGTDLAAVTFSVKENKNNKTLQASTGSVSGYTWQGPASEVAFSVDSGTGHLRISSIGISLSRQKGDADGNGRIDVSDVTAVINHILGRTPEVFNPTAADVNGDGELNVTDVTLIISIILGNSQPQ